jgi:AcrR family transcriptional regulator
MWGSLETSQRRDELAHALLEVLADQGVTAISIRNVAEQAGCTRGAIMHFFGSRERLLLYAVRYSCRTALEKIRERHVSLRGEAALRAVLLEDMELLADSRRAAAAWFGLLALAASEPQLADEFRVFNVEVGTMLAQIIAEMVADGEASPQIDPKAEAQMILGLNLQTNLDVLLQPESNTRDIITQNFKALLSRLARTSTVEAQKV